jgi:acyl carrier protein
MTHDDIRRTLLLALCEIAPEVDAASIAPGQALRAQVDLDSADWLNFLVAVDQKLGIDIPDADVAGLTTLDKFTDYIAHRQSA